MRIRGIEPELHRKFRILCAIEGKSQNKKLIELIEKATEKVDVREPSG